MKLSFTKSTLICILLLSNLPVMAQTVLIYSDHEPYGNMRTRFINDVFFKTVEAESNGNIQIKAHWGGEIAKAHNELQAIADKKTDLIVAVPEYSAKQLPLHQIFKSFAIGPTGAKQVEAIRHAYREIPELNNEYAAQNVKPVFIATGYPVAFFSPKKLNDLNELKGQTWRSASFWHRDHLHNAGAKPISSPWGKEVTDMLADGTLNGLMVNIDSAFDIKANEHAPFALYSKNLWLGHIYPVVISLDRWNSLSKADQQAFERAAEKAYTQLGAVMDKSFEDILIKAKENNTTVRMLTPKEVADWGEISQYRQVQQKWAKSQKENNVAEAEKVLNQLDKILTEAMNP